jgi:PHD/YefM family antitoxin component YafN of YafNO toxin-antitoxin module
MKGGTKRRPLQLVVEDGAPTAVILSIEEYREMLERLEDVEDLKLLERMRHRSLKFRRLEDFLAEYPPRV